MSATSGGAALPAAALGVVTAALVADALAGAVVGGGGSVQPRTTLFPGTHPSACPLYGSLLNP
jgi:hypothetical protein